MLLTPMHALLTMLFVRLGSAAPHPQSHQQSQHLNYDIYAANDEANSRAECLRRNVRYINEICTYPAQRHPCLHDTIYANGTLKHAYNIERLAGHLCDKAINHEQIPTQYCCYSDECLVYCYGIVRKKVPSYF